MKQFNMEVLVRPDLDRAAHFAAVEQAVKIRKTADNEHEARRLVLEYVWRHRYLVVRFITIEVRSVK